MMRILSPDEIVLNTENNEYIIHFSKKQRAYGFSNYGKYICTLSFRNIMDQELFKIVTNEKELLLAAEYIYDFAANVGMVVNDIIHFEHSGDLRNYYWYVYYRFEDLDKITEILDDQNQELYIGLSVYEEYQGNKAIRCNIEMTYNFLIDEFLNSIFSLLCDIRYIEEMSISEFIPWYCGEIGYYSS